MLTANAVRRRIGSPAADGAGAGAVPGAGAVAGALAGEADETLDAATVLMRFVVLLVLVRTPAGTDTEKEYQSRTNLGSIGPRNISCGNGRRTRFTVRTGYDSRGIGCSVCRRVSEQAGGDRVADHGSSVECRDRGRVHLHIKQAGIAVRGAQ